MDKEILRFRIEKECRKSPNNPWLGCFKSQVTTVAFQIRRTRKPEEMHDRALALGREADEKLFDPSSVQTLREIQEALLDKLTDLFGALK